MMNEFRSTTDRIKVKALQLGFDKVGIVQAKPLTDERRRLEEWLDGGNHGEMKWMEREPEKRADPRILFPGAKSMIVVAMNYFTPHKHVESPSIGKVSRYAWGDDYHDILKEKLFGLLGWIQTEFPDSHGKVCVDTAPIMEKAWAVRSGLGWLGKHTNLITKEFGSWVFIGEIILDIELEYENEIVEDHCGSCNACIEACPTDAITPPYLVDSNLCISYATIELRDDELPDVISKNQTGWVYGCDICQDVCPWNRFEKPTDEKRFQPREGNVSPDLRGIISLEQEEYSKRFSKSAMKRSKLTGLKRNASSLLGENPSTESSS